MPQKKPSSALNYFEGGGEGGGMWRSCTGGNKAYDGLKRSLPRELPPASSFKTQVFLLFLQSRGVTLGFMLNTSFLWEET